MTKMASHIICHLSEIRSSRDLTQQELAHVIGVSRQTINAIEQGQYNLSTLLALRLATFLETTVEELFSLPPHDQEQLIAQRTLK